MLLVLLFVLVVLLMSVVCHCSTRAAIVCLQVCNEGVLSREQLRGVQFEVRDAKIIPDAAHRGAGQIIPAAKKAMKAAVAAAGPALLEPLLSYVLRARTRMCVCMPAPVYVYACVCMFVVKCSRRSCASPP